MGVFIMEGFGGITASMVIGKLLAQLQQHRRLGTSLATV